MNFSPQHHICQWLMVVVLTLFGFSYGHTKEKEEVVYCSLEWIPFSYLDNNGQAKGLYIDIVREIFEKHLDIAVNYKQLPWKRAQYYVADGQADLLITVETEDRLQYAIPSEFPVLQLFLQVYTYKNHPQIKQITKISSAKDIYDLGLTAVTNLGNGWHEKNIDSLGVKTLYVNNEENAFNVLAEKRADLTIEPVHAGSYLINKLKLSDKIIPTDARFGPLNFYIFFSRKSAYLHLMGKINNIIKKLQESGRLKEIISEYEKINTESPL